MRVAKRPGAGSTTGRNTHINPFEGGKGQWLGSETATRISDLAVVPYRQDQSPRLDFWGSDVRNDTREGDTLWVHYTTSHFSSRSTVS